MIKDLWLNLPVKDIPRAKAFYQSLGFELHDRHANDNNAAGFVIGKQKVMVMLFPEATFETFAQLKTSDTSRGAEMLISIGIESREAVDELADKAAKAGGHVFGKPAEVQGWMYGCGFCDPDGHRWNVLWMDMDKMPG